MFIEAEFAFNEGGNDGYWRFQLRSTKTGRWVKMGGLAYFEYRIPGDKNVYRAYGTFQGNIRRGASIIRVGEGESLPPGDYEIDSRFVEPVKAMLKAGTPTSKTDVVDAPKKIDESVGEEAAGKQVVASVVGDLEVGDIVQQDRDPGLYGRITSVDHSGETTKLNVEWSDDTSFDMDLPKDKKIRVWNRDDIIPPSKEELKKRADEAKARVEAVKQEIETVDAPNVEEPATSKQINSLVKLYNKMLYSESGDKDAKDALFKAIQDKDTLTSAKAEELLNADYTEKPKVDYAAEKWGKDVALVSLDKLSEYMHVDRTDPEQQVAGYSDANIDALAKEMEEKGVYGLNQPLVLEWDPNGGWAYLVEGNHRLAAAKKAGLTELPVVVYQGMNLSGFRAQGVGAPLTLGDSPELIPDKANPSRFQQLKNSVVNKKPEIVDAPKSEVKDQNLKPEMDGEDALSIIRDAAAEVAVEDGRFPVARSAEDVEAGTKKQYAGVYEALRTESPYLVGQFLNFDEFWQYAKKYLAAGVSTRYADSVAEIPALMKAANRIYARDVLGLDPDGEITFYRNAINNHADVAKAAAGYASLDKNMAFNYNSDKESNGANGRYSVKAKPDEILGLLGYSDAVDEHGVVIGPDVTSIPGRVERLGDLGWTPANPLMDPELTNTGPGGGSKFRFFSTASTFEFPVLDANPFAAGENDKWSDFYAANGLEQGAIPGKYDELYGEGAFERDFPNSSGVPRYDIARGLFTEKGGQFALDPTKFDETFKGSNSDLQGRAGDDRDKALKFFEAVQGLSGERFMVPRGSNKVEEAKAVLQEIQSEVVDAPNVEEAKAPEINTSGESTVKDFNGKEIKPGDTARIRTDNDIFDVVFTGYDLDSLRGVTGDPSPHIAVYVPEGNSGKWKSGYYMVKAKDLNFTDYSLDFNPEEHAEEMSDRAFRLNKLKDPSEFTQVSIEQARSLGIYQGSAYASIAKFLAQTQGMDLSEVKKLDAVSDSPMTRGVGRKGEPLELTDDVMSFMATVVGNIDDVINNSPVFPDGTLLYRGLDASRNKDFPIEGILDGSITEFSSAGYSSTSSKQDVADGFAMGETPVLLKITPSSDLTGYRYQRESGNPYAEEETLLGRNVVYKVTGIEYEDRYMSEWDENNNQIVKSVPTINVEVRPAETIDVPNVVDWEPQNGSTEGKGESALLDALVDGDYLDMDAIENGTVPVKFTRDDITAEQREGLRYYTGSGYATINTLLRLGPEALPNEQHVEYAQEKLNHIDELFDIHGEVPEDTYVYRGVVDRKVKQFPMLPSEIVESLSPGDVILEPGYTSTSNRQQIAVYEFGLGMGAGTEVNSASTENFNNTIFWAIKVPKGAKALGIPTNFSAGESEVILPRGTQLSINAIRKVPQIDADTLEENGRYNYFVDADVVPQVAESETVDAPNVVEEAPAVEPKRLTTIDGGVDAFWNKEDGSEHEATELKANVAKELASKMRELGVTDEQFDAFNRYVALKNTASGPPAYLDWDGFVGVGQIKVWHGGKGELVSLTSIVRGYLHMTKDKETAEEYLRRMSSSKDFNWAMGIGDFDFTMDDTRKVLEEINSSGVFNSKYAMYSEVSIADRSEMATSMMVSDWAGSSNDAHPRSLTVQNLAEEVFGIENVSKWDRLPPKTLKQIDEYTSEFGDMCRAYLRAQYDLTQEYFRNAGISEVVLFRGMTEVEGYQLQEFDEYSVKSVDIQSRPLSSWSTSVDVAEDFARNGNIQADEDKFSIMLRRVTPVDRIFAMPFTGIGCYAEQEIVVLGGVDRADGVIGGANDVQEMKLMLEEFDKSESAKPIETRENPGPGGIIGRDELGNPIYEQPPKE